MGVRHMQGVPAHLETPKNTDGITQRVPWCVHSFHLGHHQYECTCTESPYNGILCHSAKRCPYYTKKEVAKCVTEHKNKR